MKKNYTTEEKQIVVQAYLNGKSATILSREYSVPRSTIYHWVSNAQALVLKRSEGNFYKIKRYKSVKMP